MIGDLSGWLGTMKHHTTNQMVLGSHDSFVAVGL